MTNVFQTIQGTVEEAHKRKSKEILELEQNNGRASVPVLMYIISVKTGGLVPSEHP